MITGVGHYVQAFLLVAGCNCAADKNPDVAAKPAVGQMREVAPVLPAADAAQVRIDSAACRYLVKHQPRADVVFQGGVDIGGHAVASADLNDGVPLQMPESVAVDITPELTKWLPNANPPYDRLANSKINIGTVTLTGDMVTMNGQPLSGVAQENLAVLCLQQTK